MSFADSFRTCFGHSEVLDLAFRDQFLHRSGHIFDRHVGIDTVLIEEVDQAPVGVQVLMMMLGDGAFAIFRSV